jgi:hypothetical protein
MVLMEPRQALLFLAPTEQKTKKRRRRRRRRR